METKSSIVRQLVAAKNFKKALSIAKGFRLGVKKSEQDVMTRAYECMVHPDFYKSIGTDLNKAITDGIQVLTALYG